MPSSTSTPPISPEKPDAPADAQQPSTDTPHHRPIRSFVLRTGRVTTGQQAALDALGTRYILPFQPAVLNLAQVFGRDAPTVLEIGFGMGEATAHIARQRPDENFLCCEVHTPGVGALLKRIGEEQIGNIRIIQHDAVQVLAQMIAPASLAGVHVFFPDPWHKKRHHKRRLIQQPLVHELALRLQPSGYLHCATDWQEYAEQMVQVLSAEALLRRDPAADADGYAPRPWYRPLTKFEQRGLRLGHGVWDVLHQRA